MTAITLNDLTQANVDGSGVFDVLMRANKAHLDAEFDKNRLKGSEYATVYLGSLQSVLTASIEFLMQNQKMNLEAQLLEKQILLADKELAKADAAIALIEAQKLETDAKTALVQQQTANAEIEATVLQAQKCKLDAEFDLIQAQTIKSSGETALLAQKIATEKAQVLATGVDDDSVIGKQKKLYQAQAEGFARDAEQKAAKLMVDTWNVRRTTDEGTVADGTNMLNDTAVGRAVTKLLAGVGA